MEIKFFSDIIESLGNIFSTLKGITNLPKDKRDEIRGALGDNFKILDSTFNMILIHLGEILRIQNEADFLQEVTQLSYSDTWLESERAFRLCESLKHGLREWQNIDKSIINLVSFKNWDELKEQMENILKSESELANYIGERFIILNNMALNSTSKDIKIEIQNLQKTLNEQRRNLMQLELDMYNSI